MTRQVELAWAAGFFDGEGSISFRSANNKHCPHTKRMVVSISQCEISPLQKWIKIIGFGKVNGPYFKDSTKLPCWQVAFTGKKALLVLNKILPFLKTFRFKAAKKGVKDFLDYQKAKAHPWDYKKGVKV